MMNDQALAYPPMAAASKVVITRWAMVSALFADPFAITPCNYYYIEVSLMRQEKLGKREKRGWLGIGEDLKEQMSGELNEGHAIRLMLTRRPVNIAAPHIIQACGPTP